MFGNFCTLSRIAKETKPVFKISVFTSPMWLLSNDNQYLQFFRNSFKVKLKVLMLEKLCQQNLFVILMELYQLFLMGMIQLRTSIPRPVQDSQYRVLRFLFFLYRHVEYSCLIAKSSTFVKTIFATFKLNTFHHGEINNNWTTWTFIVFPSLLILHEEEQVVNNEFCVQNTDGSLSIIFL